MTTVTFDVSYGTRAVPLRLPYLSVRRHRGAAAAGKAAMASAAAGVTLSGSQKIRLKLIVGSP